MSIPPVHPVNTSSLLIYGRQINRKARFTVDEHKHKRILKSRITPRFRHYGIGSINLDVHEGEVHALLGENGAGKSSLIKILCGIYHPDEGEMFYSGEKYAPKNTLDAIESGIRVVYQELNLLSYLSVAENIFFERLPTKAGLVDFKKLYADTRRMLDQVGLDISPKTLIEELGIAQMQLVEIAKALSSEARF